jgi:hypothetical protein
MYIAAIAADQNVGLYNHIIYGNKFTITWTVSDAEFV